MYLPAGFLRNIHKHWRINVKAVAVSMLVFAMTAVVPPAFAVDNSISPLCRAGAPAAYSRPGGYCEQVASNKSLFSGKAPRFCEYGDYAVDGVRYCNAPPTE